MAVPKGKTAHARRNKRRSHWNLTAPAVATCSHCGSRVMPHRVCDNCGFYAGVEVFEPSDS